MTNTEYVLECNNLTKQFNQLCALKSINLKIPRGKIVGLLGPNGSGKTTFIKLINGLLIPTSGELKINGLVPCTETKARVSYLPDQNYLKEWMKLSRLIDFFCDFYSDFEKEKAYEMMKRLNLDPNVPLKSLSKGMKEKVQLILVMSRNSDLYCLDEPIAGVDPASREYILNTIISNYSDNATILLSTHLISDVEMILDDAIFLQYGCVTMYQSVETLRNQHGKSLDAYFREVYRC